MRHFFTGLWHSGCTDTSEFGMHGQVLSAKIDSVYILGLHTCQTWKGSCILQPLHLFTYMGYLHAAPDGSKRVIQLLIHAVQASAVV